MKNCPGSVSRYPSVPIDAMNHEDYEKRILEACDGALLPARSCILGYQITQQGDHSGR